MGDVWGLGFGGWWLWGGGVYPLCAAARIMVPLLQRVTFLSGKVTKTICSWFGFDFVEVPSLRRRSVGPRRTDIPVLTALSRHPCRLAHSAPPAFSLHPIRVLRCLEVRGMKIKSESRSSLLLCLCRRRRSVARPAIYRAAVAKSGDSVVPDTPHALDLLPVPGRSRDKPRSYSQQWSSGDGCTNQKAKSVSSRPETET